MTTSSVTSSPDTLLRGLCVLVLLIVIIAVAYTAWIAISNYSSIGV